MFECITGRLVTMVPLLVVMMASAAGTQAQQRQHSAAQKAATAKPDALPDWLTRAISTSRRNCVKVTLKFAGPGGEVSADGFYGTGFFIDPTHIVTCYHVIHPTNLPTAPDKTPLIMITPCDARSDDIASGVVLMAYDVSPATPDDPSPKVYDFAILDLLQLPPFVVKASPLATGSSQIGEEIVFSGFPFGSTTILTHRGSISGAYHDPQTGRELRCLEASVNEGNSGGAVIDAQGSVIGIVTAKSAGLSAQLDKIIEEFSQMPPLDSSASPAEQALASLLTRFKQLAQIERSNISPGIGYATPIKVVRDYLARHPDLLHHAKPIRSAGQSQ